MTKKQKKILIRIIIAAVLWLAVNLLVEPLLPGDVPFAIRVLLPAVLFLVSYFVIGYDILRKAILGILHGEVFDENFLMAVATVGAIALGDFSEGVAVMLFYQIGELFQAVAVGKSRRNIAALMDIHPDYANIEDEDGQLEQVDPDDVEIGTLILVRPGEKVPIDGEVEEGVSTLNTSALTGESAPREIGPGGTVLSGCINMSGLLKIRTTKEFGESTVSKILELVENSSMKKSKCENFITKFARYYTPVVCYSALALAVLPTLVNLLLHNPVSWSTWITRALTFLVISCPCALVISIPLSFFAGIGAASANGILVKGSNYLEALAKTGYVVFDKTGTLTEGVFKVTKIEAVAGFESEKILEYAAHAESFSGHPISKSLTESYGKEIDHTRVSGVEEVSGQGILAMVSGVQVAAGNAKLMQSLGIWQEICQKHPNTEIGTIVYVALNGGYAGYILISDVEKSTAAEAVRALKAAGVKRTVMLTGDSRAVAEQVAARLHIDGVYSELLPGDKVEKVEELLAEKRPGEMLAFVGDGINDAPVLSRADIGIAMGALGSDAAIEAADIVLMDDNPERIALAMAIARKTLRIVYQNIVFALGVKGVCLILGAWGKADMWIAIFADVGVMVIAVLNAIRCLRIPKK